MISIANVPVGPEYPCRFVAEISNNHNHDFDQALRLLHAAKAAGADFAKLQCYTPDELVELRGDGPAPDPWGAQGWTMRTLYERAQTPFSWFPGLFREANAIGLPLFASVFGESSLALMESLDCPAYKIASLDNHVEWLTLACLKTGKPLIVSADYTVDPLADIVLLCPAGYPQASDAFTAAKYDGLPFQGMSYHGVDPSIPLNAVRAGAMMIEVHLQLAATPSNLEADISLSEIQLDWLTTLARV